MFVTLKIEWTLKKIVLLCLSWEMPVVYKTMQRTREERDHRARRWSLQVGNSDRTKCPILKWQFETLSLYNIIQQKAPSVLVHAHHVYILCTIKHTLFSFKKIINFHILFQKLLFYFHMFQKLIFYYSCTGK